MTDDDKFLRDLLAALAMAGDWASQSGEIGCFVGDEKEHFLLARARLYYRMADSMLDVREEL